MIKIIHKNYPELVYTVNIVGDMCDFYWVADGCKNFSEGLFTLSEFKKHTSRGLWIVLNKIENVE